MARSRRWIPVLIVVALLVSGPAYVGLAWWRAHLRLSSMPGEERVVEGAALADPFRRPCLFGDPLPGNAWDHYEKAAKEIAPVRDRLDGILNSAYPVRFPPDAALAEIRETGRGWIDEITRALRCETLQRNTDRVTSEEMTGVQTFLLACAEADRRAGRDAEALRLLAATLAVSADCHRGTTPLNLIQDLDAERYVVVLWKETLAAHALSAADLEAACRLLDRIEAVRPTVMDAIRLLHEMDLGRLVRFYPRIAGRDEERPEMRHLWSWTFKLCELVDDLELKYRAIEAMEGRPSWEQEKETERMEAVWEGEVQRLRRPVDHISVRSRDFLLNAVGRSLRDLVRIATALAWYQEETGRMPERLADLVPRYLPRDPVCAAYGIPVSYAGGLLTTPEQLRSSFSREAGSVDWQIRRR